MTSVDSRPVWLLDVDGVLNVTRPGWFLPWRGGSARSAGRTYELRWAPRLVTHIAELHRERSVEVRWATTWVDDIDEIEQLFGLPSMPVAFSGLGREPSAMAPRLKAAAALSVVEVERRPLIWTDDVEIPETGAFLDRLLDAGAPVLLVRPDSRIGLRPKDVRAVRDFVAGLPNR